MKIICKKAILIILCAVVTFSFTACGEDEPHPEMQIIEYTLTSEPLTLDPQIADDPSSVMLVTNLFEGLVRKNKDGDIEPGIAEKWDVSDDGLVYTFHLNENTGWSDGEAVTADDFRFGFVRTLDPVTRSENAHDLYLIKNARAYNKGKAPQSELGISAVDKNTLEITLEYPSDNLLNVLTLPAAMPCRESFFEGTKGKYGKEPELLVTNGPFLIRENYGWDHNKYIYIRRSENYKGSHAAIPLGVNFNIGNAPSDRVAALTSGECDICELYGSQLPRAQDNGISVETTGSTLWGICFNTQIKAFKNAKLRVALFGSLDRDNLLSDVPESYKKTSQLISDSVSFGGRVYRSEVGAFTLDKAQDPAEMYSKALTELEEKEINLQPSYTILSLDDDTSSQIVTKLIERFNEVTGCYFNKETLSRSELEQRIKTGDYEIAVAPLNTAIDSPMEFLSSFKSDSKSNYINLNYPAYDEFIDTALASSEVDGIIGSLKSAESYLIEYGYLYPLYYESRYFGFAPGVSGAIFSADSESIDFSKIEKITEDQQS